MTTNPKTPEALKEYNDLRNKVNAGDVNTEELARYKELEKVFSSPPESEGVPSYDEIREVAKEEFPAYKINAEMRRDDFFNGAHYTLERCAAELNRVAKERDEMKGALGEIATGILTVGEIMEVADKALKGE